MQLIVVTGLSGSGKSIALRQLEDLGYYCIDNLPGNYLVPVAEHLHSVGRDLLAVSLDSRSDASIPEISKSFKTLKEHNVDIRVLCFHRCARSEILRDTPSASLIAAFRLRPRNFSRGH